MPIPPGLPFAEAEELLHEAARKLAGADDFGPDEYREGLGVLLRSLDEDADLSEAGRLSLAGIVLVALAGRLASQAALAAHPGHRDVAIEAPIVILGLPRTGTTALHKMLCCDPANQGLELWLAQAPMPRPPREQWEAEPAYQRCVATVASMRESLPEMSAIHDMQADAPDECWNLLRQSFASVTFECVASVAAYSRWWAACDMAPAYRRWADNLRLIGLHAGDARWILKDPSHLFALDALLGELPDAIFVMTHRDPVRSIPSVCSLNSAARAQNDRHPDPHALGREQLALWGRGIDRALALREREPERFVDVHFHELRERPEEVVARIYERAGQRLAPEAARAMAAWRDGNPAHPHRYEPEAYGLSPASIRERFVDYVARCGVVLEGR